jgi:hypothetical protein
MVNKNFSLFNAQSSVYRYFLAIIFFCFFFQIHEATAQEENTVGDTDIKLYSIGGNLSLQTHAYSTTRARDLRQPLGMLATANLNFSVLGFSSGLNLRYSTDNSQLRQDLNRFSFQGGWRWLEISAGDVSPSYNKYSLRGTRVRGGQLALSPGLFLLEASGGQVNRRITGLEDDEIVGRRRQAYERWLYAARLGYGAERGNNFRLGVVYAWDEDQPLPELANGRPVPLPQENLLLSPDFQISLFDRRFQIQTMNAVSVLSRDTRAESIDLGEIGAPSFTESIFTPRTSTQINYATQVESRLSLNVFNLNVGFERIQPGYRSLGLRNIKDDAQNISIEPQVKLFNSRLNVSSQVRLGRDNLLDQRTATQRRTDFGLRIQSQLTSALSLGAGYNLLLDNTDVNVRNSDPSLNYPEQLVTSQNFSLQPAYVWSGDNASHSIAISSSLQLLDIDIDNNDRDLGNTFLSNTGSYSLSFFSGFNINTTLNYATGDAPTSDFNIIGATLGLGHSFFDRKLNTNLSAGISENRTETQSGDTIREQSQRQLNGNLTLMYRPKRSNTIRLTARTVDNAILEGTSNAFQELEVRLSVSQRF